MDRAKQTQTEWEQSEIRRRLLDKFPETMREAAAPVIDAVYLTGVQKGLSECGKMHLATFGGGNEAAPCSTH